MLLRLDRTAILGSYGSVVNHPSFGHSLRVADTTLLVWRELCPGPKIFRTWPPKRILRGVGVLLPLNTLRKVHPASLICERASLCHTQFVLTRVVQAALSIGTRDLVHHLNVLQHLTAVLLGHGSWEGFSVLRLLRGGIVIGCSFLGYNLLMLLWTRLWFNALLLSLRPFYWIERTVHLLDLSELLSFVRFLLLFGFLLHVRHQLFSR